MLALLNRLLGRSDTFASHPGMVRADVMRVAASYPLWPSLLAVAWVLSLLAVIDGFHYTAFLLLAVVTFANYAWWSSARTWFRTGDVCPAAIISAEPLMIATLTDLTAGEASYPAVKIRREPTKRWPTGPKVGSPVPCVARYDGTLGAAHWTNFHPRPVQCATDDETEVKRLLSEIDKSRWAQLQAAIRQIPKPFRPGLYMIDSAVM